MMNILKKEFPYFLFSQFKLMNIFSCNHPTFLSMISERVSLYCLGVFIKFSFINCFHIGVLFLFVHRGTFILLLSITHVKISLIDK